MRYTQDGDEWKLTLFGFLVFLGFCFSITWLRDLPKEEQFILILAAVVVGIVIFLVKKFYFNK